MAQLSCATAVVIHLMKRLTLAWSDCGIRVNAISPRYTLMAMNQRAEVAEQLKHFAADTPVGRIATGAEMVGPVIFPASEAAAFCTGANLLVDGGVVCW